MTEVRKAVIREVNAVGGKIEITDLQDTLGLTTQRLEEALHYVVE